MHNWIALLEIYFCDACRLSGYVQAWQGNMFTLYICFLTCSITHPRFHDTLWLFWWEDTQTDWSQHSLVTVVLNTVRCLHKFGRDCQEMIEHCRSLIWWNSVSSSWMMWQLRNSVKLKTATGLQFWRTAVILSILTELGKLLEITSKYLLKKIWSRNCNIRNHGLMNSVQNF